MKKLFLVIMVLGLCFVLSTNVLATQKTLTVVSKPDPLKIDQWVYGPLYFFYAPMGDIAWGDAGPTVSTYDSRWGDPIPTVTWISTAEVIENNQVDSWRWFHAKMNIACTAYNITGSVVVTSDNAEEFYFNGLYIGTDGEVQVDYIDNSEWRTLITYPIIAQAGSNTLDFIVRNYPPWSPTAICCYYPDEPNPTGLIFKATVNYELADVVWQPPLTNESFELKDGTTMPFKFKLHTPAGDLIIDQMNVYLKIFGPSDGGMGDEVAFFWPGEGGDFLRFDLYESYYIGNFRTKDYGLTEGATYTAVVFDGCTDDVLATYPFVVSAGKGNRANKN